MGCRGRDIHRYRRALRIVALIRKRPRLECQRIYILMLDKVIPLGLIEVCRILAFKVRGQGRRCQIVLVGHPLLRGITRQRRQVAPLRVTILQKIFPKPLLINTNRHIGGKRI